MIKTICKTTIITLIVMFFIFALTYALYFYPRMIANYEAVNLKEYTDNNLSKGDCRIVNSKIAIDNNFRLLALDKYDYNESLRHIIAVDDKNIVYDTSRGTNALQSEKLEDFLSRNDLFVYLVLHPKENDWEYLGGVDYDIIYTASFLQYFYFFKNSYNNKTYQ